MLYIISPVSGALLDKVRPMPSAVGTFVYGVRTVKGAWLIAAVVYSVIFACGDWAFGVRQAVCVCVCMCVCMCVCVCVCVSRDVDVTTGASPLNCTMRAPLLFTPVVSNDGERVFVISSTPTGTVRGAGVRSRSSHGVS